MSYRGMFAEGPPVTQSASGAVTVHLGADHPSFQRRSACFEEVAGGFFESVDDDTPERPGVSVAA